GTCDYDEQSNVLRTMSSDVESKLVSIHFCTQKNALMKITYGQTEKDFLDGYIREIIDPRFNLPVQVFDSHIDPKAWNLKRLLIYPIHTGQYFGLIGRIINFVLGLSLSFLFVTGIRLSIKRAGFKLLSRDRSVLIADVDELQPSQNVD
ncbi:MAG: PepSY-associated TM helix domain-containing protein, partial [Bacteriovoracaceae bacterium]